MPFILMTVLMPSASGQPPDDSPDLDELLAGLKTTYSQTESLQADFTQLTRSEAFGDGPVQTGQLTLGQPRMMRVEFAGETGSLFLCDSTNLYVYSKIGNQVIITPDVVGSSDGVSDLITNLATLEEQFEISLMDADPANPGSLDLSLAPKEDARFKSMQLSMTADFRVTRLSVTDAFDSTTEMRFSNMVLDPNLPEGIFQFEIPADAQVIRSGEI
jgi:outer membrane lipoprotein carrier protein